MGYENVLIIVIVAGILLFGSKKLPELFRTIGRAQSEYEKAKLEAKSELNKVHEVLDDGKAKRKNLEDIALKLEIPDPELLSDEDLSQSIQKKIGTKLS
ncbi:Sec-independent protein translocase subunit TatA/TatB [Nitrososphaera sp. AFS]|uniref:Sec-independent protein translocase subunit TatA/TatB n=1 Tax=Nitrososphaera sp. AFS TaxID=2301191 RepID=UPI0013922197|nr:twin-arginine translocase TatA/TatE family subunit [Nitrososphaera sp. AFS]NAL77445.1 twin-arginine translocase TatA/TatE family subunit [Nitrososphaera sp. AFS]